MKCSRQKSLNERRLRTLSIKCCFCTPAPINQTSHRCVTKMSGVKRNIWTSQQTEIFLSLTKEELLLRGINKRRFIELHSFTGCSIEALTKNSEFKERFFPREKAAVNITGGYSFESSSLSSLTQEVFLLLNQSGSPIFTRHFQKKADSIGPSFHPLIEHQVSWGGSVNSRNQRHNNKTTTTFNKLTRMVPEQSLSLAHQRRGRYRPKS